MGSIKRYRPNFLESYGIILTSAVLAMILLSVKAHAQKGMGDYEGMARRRLTPAIIRLSGAVQEIRTHPCEHTTGRAELGTHLILKNDKKQEFNIHIGPAEEVAKIVKRLSVGRKIEIQGFRTAKMPANHYVAKTLVLGKRVIELRDSMLRPYWSRNSLLGVGGRNDPIAVKDKAKSGSNYNSGRWWKQRGCLRNDYRRGRCFGRGFGGRGFGACRRNNRNLQPNRFR